MDSNGKMHSTGLFHLPKSQLASTITVVKISLQVSQTELEGLGKHYSGFLSILEAGSYWIAVPLLHLTQYYNRQAVAIQEFRKKPFPAPPGDVKRLKYVCKADAVPLSNGPCPLGKRRRKANRNTTQQIHLLGWAPPCQIPPVSPRAKARAIPSCCTSAKGHMHWQNKNSYFQSQCRCT